MSAWAKRRSAGLACGSRAPGHSLGHACKAQRLNDRNTHVCSRARTAAASAAILPRSLLMHYHANGDVLVVQASPTALLSWLPPLLQRAPPARRRSQRPSNELKKSSLALRCTYMYLLKSYGMNWLRHTSNSRAARHASDAGRQRHARRIAELAARTLLQQRRDRVALPLSLHECI